MKLLDIGEVCARTGLRPSALRYYEEIGLISSASRNGLRRQFTPATVTQLALITMGKSAGFRLNEISDMFGADGTPALPRDALHDKADLLDRQIAELKAMRDAIRHVAECPAPSHLECPKFQRLIAIFTRRRKTSKTTRAPKVTS